MLKKILIVLVVLIAGLLIVVAMRPADFRVERSVTPIPAGIFPLPSGEIKNDRTGIRSIGMVFTLPAFMSSGVVVPRGVSGMRYAVFIQKLSSGVSSARIHESDLAQYVAKYPGTTSRPASRDGP